LLFCGLAVDSSPSVCAELLPHLRKGMAQTTRDTASADFRGLQPMATVCEQSATVSVVGGRRKQFATDCNTHQQGRRSQTAKHLVVEHKVGMRCWVFWRSFCCCGCGSGGMRFGGPASRLRCAPDLRFSPSQTASTIPLQVERRSRMAQRAIRFSETTGEPSRPCLRSWTVWPGWC